MVPTQSTTVTEDSATHTPIGLSNFTAGAPVRVPVPTIDSVRVRFDDGYRTVMMAVTHLPNATVLTFEVSGTLVRVWDYGNAGYGIKVKSASCATTWHVVTRTTCTCAARAYKHRCHHVAIAHEAETVLLAWQYARRCEMRRVRKEVA